MGITSSLTNHIALDPPEAHALIQLYFQRVLGDGEIRWIVGTNIMKYNEKI